MGEKKSEFGVDEIDWVYVGWMFDCFEIGVEG